MSEISGFYGIIVSMFYDDRNPPHFHARYSEYKIVIDINLLRILEGDLSFQLDKEIGNLTWNGEDIAPEALYSEATHAPPPEWLKN